MPRRTPQTLADYLVVGICPALITLLVGSLMWFLVEVFYQGEHKGRLLWVMAMFVIAIVGIARIAMEKGMAYASMFGWALAVAIAMALSQFVENGLIIGGPIMILVWWAAHKLTWDCTLIDDTQDATGQGLLQQMGLDPSAAPAKNVPLGTTTRAGEPEATTHLQDASATPPMPPWWETLLEPDRRPHAPGVWVVYFSLVALPLFGLGGWFVSEPVARARVFGLLVIYVACGMGLLLATSFLGLRRYLRQRKLEMPMEMTTTWILVGVVMICAMLLVAAILPRPSREYSLSQLPFTVTSAARRASKFAFGREGTKDDATKDAAKGEANDGQQTDRSGGTSGKSDAQNKPSGNSSGKGEQGTGGKGKSEQGKASGDKSGKEGKSQSGSAKGGDAKGSNSDKNSDKTSQNSEQKSDQKSDQKSSQSTEQNSPPPQQDQPQQQPAQSNNAPSRISFNPLSLLSKLLGFGIKWLFYGGLIIALVVAAWMYRDELQAAWKKLMNELRELWDWWFGKKKATEESTIPTNVVAPPRMFASYPDPFATGDARRMSWPQLVRYTFEALEAWGREHNCPRAAGQTANEFALALSALEPEIAATTQSLAASYSQLAYANQAAAGSPEPLRQLWTQLRTRQTHLAIA